MSSVTVASTAQMRTRARVAAGCLGGGPDRGDRAGERLVAEEGVQHDGVGDPAGELEGLAADGHHQHRDVLVEAAVEAEEREPPGRAVVVEGLAAPEPAVDADGVLELGAGHPGHAHQVEEHVEAAAEPERVAAAGHPVGGDRHGRGDQRVAGVVVGGRRTDADRRAHRTRGSREHRGVLGVEALGQEDRAEAELLGQPHLVEQVAGRGAVAGQAVAAELGKLLVRQVIQPSMRVCDELYGDARDQPLRRVVP